MDIALLTDIKDKLFMRSALLAIEDLDEILSINDKFSADKILLELIKKSLREFEKTNPLILEMKVTRDQLKTCNNMPGYGEVKSNFTLYLDCMISEDQIILVPNSIPKWRACSTNFLGCSSFPTPGAYTYFSDYKRPYIFLGDMPCNEIFFMKGICSRPIIPDFLPDNTFNPNSGKAAVYWMNIEEGARGEYFLDLCLANLLDYIRQQKASVGLPGLGIDVMGNVDSAYQEVRSRCDQQALQSGWYGELVE